MKLFLATIKKSWDNKILERYIVAKTMAKAIVAAEKMYKYPVIAIKLVTEDSVTVSKD